MTNFAAGSKLTEDELDLVMRGFGFQSAYEADKVFRHNDARRLAGERRTVEGAMPQDLVERIDMEARAMQLRLEREAKRRAAARAGRHKVLARKSAAAAGGGS